MSLRAEYPERVGWRAARAQRRAGVGRDRLSLIDSPETMIIDAFQGLADRLLLVAQAQGRVVLDRFFLGFTRRSAGMGGGSCGVASFWRSGWWQHGRIWLFHLQI